MLKVTQATTRQSPSAEDVSSHAQPVFPLLLPRKGGSVDKASPSAVGSVFTQPENKSAQLIPHFFLASAAMILISDPSLELSRPKVLAPLGGTKLERRSGSGGEGTEGRPCCCFLPNQCFHPRASQLFCSMRENMNICVCFE